MNNSDARTMIAHDEFAPVVQEIKAELPDIKTDNYFVVGQFWECRSFRLYVKYFVFRTASPASCA